MIYFKSNLIAICYLQFSFKSCNAGRKVYFMLKEMRLENVTYTLNGVRITCRGLPNGKFTVSIPSNAADGLRRSEIIDITRSIFKTFKEKTQF